MIECTTYEPTYTVAALTAEGKVEIRQISPREGKVDAKQAQEVLRRIPLELGRLDTMTTSNTCPECHDTGSSLRSLAEDLLDGNLSGEPSLCGTCGKKPRSAYVELGLTQ